MEYKYKLYLLCVLVLYFITSCKSNKEIIKYVEIPVETIKTEYIHDIKVDSIYVRDSIDRYLKGDTLYIYKEKLQYRYIYNVDTIVKNDTIPKIITTKEIEQVEVNHIYKWQKLLMWLGGLWTLLIVGFIVYKVKIK